MKAFQHKSNLKHTAVLLFGIMMSCATVKAQDIPCLPSSFGETDSQSAWCGIVAYTLHITGYGDSDGGYVLLASPVGTVNPEDVTNMLTNAYDLYAFDQNPSDGLEWRNYEANSFNLVSGKGYLYASQQNTMLIFTGTPYSGNGEVTLSKTTGAQFVGWNLVGNPFNDNATIDMPYYRMNADGTALNTETESTAVAAMEGVFVKANEDGEIVTFGVQTRGGEKCAVAALNISLSKLIEVKVPEPVEGPTQNNGVSTSSTTLALDNAIIRFDSGQTLEKFSFREGSTKIYIPQDGKDYAIATSNGQGEMPVNFKAKGNGTYTITVNVDNVELAYLHLIDNLTGADVDLLASPTYTFTAKTTDYESRFKLVFSASADANGDNEAFAFIDASGNIIVNGEGILQMVDVTGRIVLSVGGHTWCVPTTGMTAGVYILRLITGNDVKTQKIVVE